MKNEIPIDWRWTFKICIVWFTVGFDSLIKFLKRKKNFEGTHGFEPWTYRTAADCSTTELYPRRQIARWPMHRQRSQPVCACPLCAQLRSEDTPTTISHL